MVHIKFTDYPEDRESKSIGPFVYVQLTYGLLRGALKEGEDDSDIASLTPDEKWLWEGKEWSDITIF